MITVVAVILNATAAMYQARQETRRKEIERAAANELAAALARSIDDAHARAHNVPETHQAEEAARVRASAAQIMVDMTPAILALLGQGPEQSIAMPQVSQRPR